MSESIFQEGDNLPILDNPAPLTIPTEVADLVGEGKKYSTVEDALKALPHAQSHISKIEEENAKMRDELAKRKTTEELLDEIKSGIKPSADGTQVEITTDKIASLVKQVIAQTESSKTATQNTKTVIQKMTEKYGEHAEAEFIKIAENTGMSVDTLNRLAATSPTAVLKLGGLDITPTPQPTPSKGTVNTEALRGHQPPQVPDAKVGPNATTKEMVRAWKAAGEKVKQNQS